MTKFSSNTTRGGNVRTTTGGVYKFEKVQARKFNPNLTWDPSYELPFIFKTIAFVAAVVAAVVYLF